MEAQGTEQKEGIDDREKYMMPPIYPRVLSRIDPMRPREKLDETPTSPREKLDETPIIKKNMIHHSLQTRNFSS